MISKTHEGDLKQYFPDFLFLVRDCDREILDSDGRTISATEYLHKKILTVTSGDADNPRSRTIRSIRACFPTIECLQISNPGPGISNSKSKKPIDEDFTKQMNSVIDHILCNIKAKRSFNLVTEVDGSMMASLLQLYVEALNTPDAIPNLEVSHWTVIDNTLQQVIKLHSEKYSKKMHELLDRHLPIEEGNLEDLKRTHLSRIHESLNGEVQAEKAFTTVQRTYTLFQVHENVYSTQLATLSAKIHKLIPATATIEDKVENEKKLHFLKVFESEVIKLTDGNITGGLLQNFVQLNKEKSNTSCVKCFQKAYQQQKQKQTGVSLKELRENYYKEAIGPAKMDVFQDHFSEIPGPPTELRKENSSGNSLTISWKRPNINADAAISWNVVRLEKGKSLDHAVKYFIPFNEDQKHSFQITDLRPKCRYLLKVCGLKSEQTPGEYSKQIELATKAGKPDQPEVPVIIPQSHSVGNLLVDMLSESKQNGSPVSHIVIIQYSKSDVWEVKRVQVDPNKGSPQSVQVNITCEEGDETLWFRVQLKNEAGPSEPSKGAPLTIDKMIPSEPQNVKIFVKAREIELKWDPPRYNPKAVKTYHLQYRQLRAGQSKSNWTELNLNKTVNNYEILNLIPKTKYLIQICARNNDVCSEYEHRETETLAAAPNKPQNLSIKVTSANKAKITFCRQSSNDENGSPVKAILVYYATRSMETSSSTNWTKIKEHEIDQSTKGESGYECIEIDLNSLTCASTVSSYCIAAQNSVGPSERSLPVDLHPDSIIPGEPQALTETKVSADSIEISWKEPNFNPKAAKTYHFWYQELRAGQSKSNWIKTTLSGTVNHHEIFDLIPKTKYLIKICARNNDLRSQYAHKEVETLAAVPNKPQIHSIKVTSANKAELRFCRQSSKDENGSPVKAIVVYYATKSAETSSSTNWTKIKEHEIDQSTKGESGYECIEIDLNSLTCASTVSSYCIVAQNSVGPSEQSLPVDLHPDSIIPGEPQALTKTKVSADSIEISWKEPNFNPKAAKTYHFQYQELRAGQSKSNWIETTLSGTVNHHEIFDLIPKTKYLIEICARNSDLQSQYAHKEVETLAAVPNKPQIHSIKVTSANKAKLTFCRQSSKDENGSPVKAIVVYYATKSAETSSSTNWTKIKEHEINRSTKGESGYECIEIDLNSLTCASTISSYCIAAQNSVGPSERSLPVDLHPDSIIPGEPQALTETKVSADSIEISWKEPNFNPKAAKKYQVGHKVASEVSWNNMHIEVSELNVHTEKSEFTNQFSNLKPNNKYKFYVQAINGNQTSKIVYLTVQTKSSPPPKPKTPILIPKGNDYLLKLFLPAVAASGSEVCKLHVHYYNQNTEKPFKTESFDIDLNKVTVTEENQTVIRHYSESIQVNIDCTQWISISLTNEIGRSKESDLVGVTHGDVTPGKPEKLEADPEQRQMILTWGLPKVNGNAVKYYEILMRNDSNKYEKLKANYIIMQERNPQGNLSYRAVIEGLNPYTLYKFGVQAVNFNIQDISSKTRVSDMVCIEEVTLKAPPEKPLPPVVEPIPDDAIKALYTLPLLEEKQLNGGTLKAIIIEYTYDGNNWTQWRNVPQQEETPHLQLQEETPHMSQLWEETPHLQLQEETSHIQPQEEKPHLQPWEETPHLQPQEETPHIQPWEETPHLQLREETPHIQPWEETPHIQPWEETPCLQPQEETPHIQPQEETSHLQPWEKKIIEDIPNLSENTGYLLFRIKMQNEVGQSVPSDHFFLPISILQPGQPQNLTILHKDAHSIKIKWEQPLYHPALAKGYIVEYSNINVDTISLSMDNSRLEHEILGLKSNQEYVIKVSAIALKRSQPAQIVSSTLEIYPGKPTSLCFDKIGIDALKIRWSNPTINASEVSFYKVELRVGKHKEALQNGSFITASRTRQTKGNSTVFKNLKSFTTYTISVSAFNDNKETRDATDHIEGRTKMGGHARRSLQALTAVPSLGMASVALGYSLAPDQDIQESDEEYHDPDAFPSAPQNLHVSNLRSTYFNAKWDQPNVNLEELSHYKVQALEVGENDPDFSCEVQKQEHIKVHSLKPNTKYTFSVTSYNYFKHTNPKGATSSIEVQTAEQVSKIN